jgi:hypothetical protein
MPPCQLTASKNPDAPGVVLRYNILQKMKGRAHLSRSSQKSTGEKTGARGPGYTAPTGQNFLLRGEEV